jgi:hypothetical protein
VPAVAYAEPAELVPGFTCESELERRALREPELLRGLAWGGPRPGHPEGRVGEHVAEILRLVDPASPYRADLRFVALVHDSFKWRTRCAPSYSPNNDHAVLARRFAERLTGDRRLLDTIELHDEPYWILCHRAASRLLLLDVLARVADPALFVTFVELDAATEGKHPGLLHWLRETA